MTRPDLIQENLVGRLEERLSSLLQKADGIKIGHAVEPQLPPAGIAQDIDEIGQGAAVGPLALETAARRLFYQIIQGTTVDEPGFARIWNLLDIAIGCAERNQAEQNLPFYLIEELLETQTTDGCRRVFEYLESRRERLLQKDFSKTHLVVLRFCNELLRRLSRAEDAVFCGRVFFFLFQSFPLSDPSSVNLRGEFHVDNVTKFETFATEATATATATAQAQVSMDIDTDTSPKDDTATADDPTNTQESAPAVTTTNKDDNATFYTIFWQLQQDFSLPTRLFDDGHLSRFKDGLELTLTKFIQTPVVVQARGGSGGDEPRGTKRKAGSDDIAQDSITHNAKYLTSRELFDLELSDLAFQRHILVQALILIDFLLSLTEKAKKKTEDAKLSVVNRAVVYSYVLGEEKRIWATTTRAKIADYLQKGPDGNFYYRMVNTVLSRDKNWARWKVERCPVIVADAVPCEQILEAKIAARHSTTIRKTKGKPMGAVDLKFLSQAADSNGGLERLRNPNRCAKGSISKLVDDMLVDKMDAEMATSDEMPALKAAFDNKLWRAVRAIAASNMSSLEKLDNVPTAEEFLQAPGEGEGAYEKLRDEARRIGTAVERAVK